MSRYNKIDSKTRQEYVLIFTDRDGTEVSRKKLHLNNVERIRLAAQARKAGDRELYHSSNGALVA